MEKVQIIPSEFTIEYIKENAEDLDWSEISKKTHLDVISKLALEKGFKRYLSWKEISKRKLTFEFIKQHQEKLSWPYVVSNYPTTDIDDPFFCEFEDKNIWPELSKRHLDLEFVKNFSDKLDLKLLSKKAKRRLYDVQELLIMRDCPLSGISPLKKILAKAKAQYLEIHEVYVSKITAEDEIKDPKKYTKEYIIRNADSINWKLVSQYSPLDELNHVADDFNEEIDWSLISERDDLSAKFILKHKEYFVNSHKGDIFYQICLNNPLEVIYELDKDSDFEFDCHCFEILQSRELSEEFVRKHSHNIYFAVFLKSDHIKQFSKKFFTDFEREIKLYFR